ncbi:hypothetical protein [Streptomyces sp. NPDC048057]|uniref:hypothetical protein n=1 Tax=Streptomyces sp. NPDC048057 TaxID=3155628 RepID=UPI003403C1DA
MTHPGLPPGDEERARMTLRVSRDSGRTWGPTTVVCCAEPRDLPVEPMRFPPCRCPRCHDTNARLTPEALA